MAVPGIGNVSGGHTGAGEVTRYLVGRILCCQTAYNALDRPHRKELGLKG